MTKAITPPNAPDLLKDKRNQTDGSLTTERGKTDESLFELRRKAEQETDEKVRHDRQDADQARTQSRSETDEKHPVSERMSDQRQFADDAVIAERSSMDAAIHKERAEKEAVLNRFLFAERQDTDGNLRKERQQTDTEVQKSIARIAEEASSHSLTKEALTTRDQFLAIVSHDLRNPIGAVASCAQMLLDDPSYSDMSNDSKYWIEFMKRNAETSLRLISDLLDMERIAEGKLEISFAKHSLSKLAQEVVEANIYSASARRILLRAIPSNLDTTCSFDRDRIGQVLSNLIGNALKFTPEGGSVTVRIEVVDRMMKVSIADTGPGIPKEECSRIFDRFAQINKKDRRGLGLGLFISKTLVELHQGSLAVDCPQAGGSVFSFTLPIQSM